MTDETQVETPIEDAPVDADPSPAPEVETVETPVEPKVEQPRDEDGKFLSEKAQKRIDHLTWEKNQREREAEYWRAQAMQPKPTEPPRVESQKLPTLEEVGYDEAKYQAALLEFATSKAEQAVEARFAKAENEATERKRVETFAERQRAFGKATPDFEDKVLRDPTLPITSGMRDVILDSENGPEIAYYLANNREFAEQISQLPVHLAALQMGRIEGRLAAQKEAAKRPPPVSQAPPPPPTVESSAAVASVSTADATGDRLSDDEWFKAEKKRLSRKR